MAYTNVRSCTHIKVDGVRCDSPALRGEQFCYFHQRALRQVKTPPNARLHPIALIENEEAIQASLMEVINALLRNTIDLKRAELILRALHIAVKNVRFSKFGIHAHNMVKEVPEYNEAPRVEPERFDKPRSEPRPPVPTSEEIKRFAAESWAQYEKEKARGGAEAFLRPSIQSEANGSMPSASGTGHVGTAAPGCPSGPDVPGRSAVDRLKSTTNGKGAASSRSDQAAKQTAASAAEGRSSQPPRKPPISDKAEAPKERKTTAQRASAG